MRLARELKELEEAGVISGETAQAIAAYYLDKQNKSPNRLITVFAVLGAVLIGLGTILILAHNWDNLSRTVKTGIAFLPLLAGQVACAWSIFREKNSTAWRESSSAFLFLAIGASISLVAQVYHVSGDFSNFMFTWMLLGLPLVYLLKASFTALLYIAGITIYANSTGYSPAFADQGLFYWLLLVAILPHYLALIKQTPEAGFTRALGWFLAISLSISLGAVAHRHEELLITNYMNLFALFFLLATTSPEIRKSTNGFRITGLVGMLVLLVIASFKDFWEGLKNKIYGNQFILFEPEFITGICFGLVALFLLRRQLKSQSSTALSPFSWVFIAFTGIYYFGCYPKLAAILINLLTLAAGILTVLRGSKLNHLGILNFGLVILSALVVCRFFDTDLSFVTRGILFVGLGLGFFVANYQLLKKRKES